MLRRAHGKRDPGKAFKKRVRRGKPRRGKLIPEKERRRRGMLIIFLKKAQDCSTIRISP